jgi:hypothetical protein
MPSAAARKLLIPCELFAGPLNQRRQTARLWDSPDAANQSPGRNRRVMIPNKDRNKQHDFRK